MVAAADRVRVFWTGTGTSTPITLGAAVSDKFFTVPSSMNGKEVTYLIEHQGEGVDEVEVGRGVYTHSGTSLARTSIIVSTNGGFGGSAVDFSAGTKHVSLTIAVSDLEGRFISTQTETTIDGANDFLLFWDATDSALKKLKPNNLPGTSTVADGSITVAKFASSVYADTEDVDPGTEDTKIVTVLRAFEVVSAALADQVGVSIAAFIHTHELSAITDAGALASKDTVASGDLTTALSEAIFWPISTVQDTVATQVPDGYNTYTYTDNNGSGTIILLSSAIAAGEGVVLHHGGADVDPIIIPDNSLSINGSDQTAAPTTATITLQNASGASGEFAASATLPDAVQGAIYRLTNHATGNGVYLVGATHTTSLWAVTRIDGANFANAAAESADVGLVTGLTLKSLAAVRRIGTDFIVLGGTTAPKSMDTSNISDVGDLDMDGDLLGATLGTGVVIPETIIVALSDETTNLTTGTAKVTLRMPWAATLVGLRAQVNTAPTGSTIIVDINESNSTILSTRLTIDATEETSVTATPAVISDAALADDAELTFDIDQVGSSTPGKGLKVILYLTRTLA